MMLKMQKTSLQQFILSKHFAYNMIVICGYVLGPTVFVCILAALDASFCLLLIFHLLCAASITFTQDLIILCVFLHLQHHCNNLFCQNILLITCSYLWVCVRPYCVCVYTSCTRCILLSFCSFTTIYVQGVSHSHKI